LLCLNCNHAKAAYGYCPHEKGTNHFLTPSSTS
jgi:hypothetical protein